jgi:hypothetical protein
MTGAATAGWSKPLVAALSWPPLQVDSYHHVDLLGVSILLNAACCF